MLSKDARQRRHRAELPNLVPSVSFWFARENVRPYCHAIVQLRSVLIKALVEVERDQLSPLVLAVRIQRKFPWYRTNPVQSSALLRARPAKTNWSGSSNFDRVRKTLSPIGEVQCRRGHQCGGQH